MIGGGVELDIFGVEIIKKGGAFMHIDGDGRNERLQAFTLDVGTGGEVAIGAFFKLGHDPQRIIDRKKVKETDYQILYNMTNAMHYCTDAAIFGPEARQAMRVMCAEELKLLQSPTS